MGRLLNGSFVNETHSEWLMFGEIFARRKSKHLFWHIEELDKAKGRKQNSIEIEKRRIEDARESYVKQLSPTIYKR